MQEVEDPLLLPTVVAFVRVASAMPAPDEVGFGYWRNSMRLIWPNVEAEIFQSSIEIYRFDAAGTQIVTVAFHPGDALPAELLEAMDANPNTGRTC